MFTELQPRPTTAYPWPVGDTRPDDVFFGDPTRRWRRVERLELARAWRHSFNYESDEEDPRFRQHIGEMLSALRSELD